MTHWDFDIAERKDAIECFVAVGSFARTNKQKRNTFLCLKTPESYKVKRVFPKYSLIDISNGRLGGECCSMTAFCLTLPNDSTEWCFTTTVTLTWWNKRTKWRSNYWRLLDITERKNSMLLSECRFMHQEEKKSAVIWLSLHYQVKEHSTCSCSVTVDWKKNETADGSITVPSEHHDA